MKAQVNRVRRYIMGKLTGNIGSRHGAEEISAMIGNKRGVERILVLRPNSRLGNQLLITPLLQELINYFPGCKIDLFVRGGVASAVLANYNEVDRVIKLPPKPFKQLWQYAKVWLSVRKYRYDIVFNIEGGSSSGRLLTKMAKSDIKLFGDKIPGIEERYADYNHMGKKAAYNLRHYLGKELDSPIPPLSLKLDSEELANGKRLLEKMTSAVKPTICIYTFATGSKRYSCEWWERLYKCLETQYGNHFHILEVLPKERVSQIGFKAETYYSTDLREMGAVMANSSVFITADCGVMHLASSAGVPTVGLFSITPPASYAPYNYGSVAVDTAGIEPEDIIPYVSGILMTRTIAVSLDVARALKGSDVEVMR